MAMVLIQQPEARVGPFRKRLDRFIGDKHEEVMAKLGAIMAAGGQAEGPGFRAHSRSHTATCEVVLGAIVAADARGVQGVVGKHEVTLGNEGSLLVAAWALRCHQCNVPPVNPIRLCSSA